MVVTMKTPNRWLGFLSAAVIMSSAGVLAYSSTGSTSYSPSCVSDFYGDGDCDDYNNNAECGYDGGDCCPCTCVDTEAYICGQSTAGRFACIDPEAPCVDDDDITAELVEKCNVDQLGDGRCNARNNNKECGYDSGDCCECTCVPPEHDDDSDYLCGPQSGYACIDPSAACVDEDSVTVDMIGVCFVLGIGDGYCNTKNNKPECNYDGGDCCECTCSPRGDDNWSCRELACVDPSAPCVDDDIVTVEMLEVCPYVTGIGNGWCDEGNNKPECAYDGGDCCECTCVQQEAIDDSSSANGCYEFACIDPEAECVDDDDVTVDMYENCDYPIGIGNGWCDEGNNKEECGFDGGDCCSCTCESTNIFDDDYACSPNGSGFNCKDTSAECFGEPPTYTGDDDDSAMSYEFVPWEQDGPLPTMDGAVEVGAVTEVGVSATAYDVRPGRSDHQVGCGPVGGDGCAPENSRDGIASEIESRWSCATKITDGGAPCQIEYTFAEPQNIKDILVDFWKVNERVRTLTVHLDGELTHTHESYASEFNSLGVTGFAVSTVKLESTGLLSDEWISLIEVLIFVEP